MSKCSCKNIHPLNLKVLRSTNLLSRATFSSLPSWKLTGVDATTPHCLLIILPHIPPFGKVTSNYTTAKSLAWRLWWKHLQRGDNTTTGSNILPVPKPVPTVSGLVAQSDYKPDMMKWTQVWKLSQGNERMKRLYLKEGLLLKVKSLFRVL